MKTKTRESVTVDDLRHEAGHLVIIADLLEDAARVQAGVNIDTVRQYAAWLHRAVGDFQDMYGRIPDPLTPDELLEQVKRQATDWKSDYLQTLADAIAKAQQLRKELGKKHGKS